MNLPWIPAVSPSSITQSMDLEGPDRQILYGSPVQMGNPDVGQNIDC